MGKGAQGIGGSRKQSIEALEEVLQAVSIEARLDRELASHAIGLEFLSTPPSAVAQQEVGDLVPEQSRDPGVVAGQPDGPEGEGDQVAG